MRISLDGGDFPPRGEKTSRKSPREALVPDSEARDRPVRGRESTGPRPGRALLQQPFLKRYHRRGKSPLEVRGSPVPGGSRSPLRPLEVGLPSGLAIEPILNKDVCLRCVKSRARSPLTVVWSPKASNAGGARMGRVLAVL
jgi:hypothetical protein